MVWQEAFPPTGGPAFDAEAERERRLAAQARAGAAWALTALIARYQPTVVRYLTRLCGSQAEAQRLAERIFQRMERRLHGPHGAENLRLWLLRACTEAGLDALRRPHTRAMPRVGGSSVAGLLTEQSGADAANILRGGLRRLRKAGGAVQRQARPLVWSDPQASPAGPDGPTSPPAAARRAESARPSADQHRDQHLDEALDRLDPRDALRHRLVRVTLAELPYGDAQCLALHLVAGLNQAEVARALGITNSAARRRIVHGLALFSDRYAQAVQSLGLPTELGYGDALPRAPMEPEPMAPQVAEPVIVPEQAPDGAEWAASAANDEREVYADELAAAQAERGHDALSAVSYLSQDSDKLAAIRTPTGGPAPRGEDDYGADYGESYGVGYGDVMAAGAPTPVVASADDAPAEPATLSASAAPVNGGSITRVASDAIIGPIVDALPVTASNPESSGVFGLPGPRSAPLAYELSSSHTPNSPDASEIRMRWLDDSGMLTPLTFEAVAVSSAASAPQPTDDDGPLTPLSYEATAAHASVETGAEEPSATADDAPLAFELAPVATDPSDQFDQMALGMAQADWVAGMEDDVPPLALVAEQAPPEPVTVPVTTPRHTPRLLAEAEAPSGAGADRRLTSTEPELPELPELPEPPETAETAETAETTETTETTGQFEPRPLGGVITRSLEDLWDEAPDGIDF